MDQHPKTGLGRTVNVLEETCIAAILGAMTLITFANVVARYAFNSNILWALEATSFLFAWLVLLGASYAVKTFGPPRRRRHREHGVGPARRALGLIAAAICVIFALLLVKGAWDFWAPYAELQPTTGRWFPTGFASARGQGWYEVNDIPMPEFMNQAVADVFNVGERYEKMPRLIPYAILPVATFLLVLRFVQAAIGLARGSRRSLIASHEVEDAIEDIEARRQEAR